MTYQNVDHFSHRLFTPTFFWRETELSCVLKLEGRRQQAPGRRGGLIRNRFFRRSPCYMKRVRSSRPTLQLFRLSFELMTHIKRSGGGASMHSSCIYKCMLTPRQHSGMERTPDNISLQKELLSPPPFVFMGKSHGPPPTHPRP